MSNRVLKITGIVLGLAILLVIGIIVANLYRPDGLNRENRTSQGQSSTPGEADEQIFPDKILGLSLIKTESGPRAMGMISQLHGANISIKEGYIAQYGGPGGQIMIWVSESNSTSEAEKLFTIMDEKISSMQNNTGQSSPSEGPPFTDRRVLTRNDLQVVAVHGMGMENYYYQKGTKVYWVAVGGVDRLKVLDEVLKSM